MGKLKKTGRVEERLFKDLGCFCGISAKDLIGDIAEIDIGKAVLEEGEFSRNIWDYPGAFLFRNLEDNTNYIIYATKIRHNNPKNISNISGASLFTESSPVQEVLINTRTNYIELTTETKKYWHKIKAYYDANQKIIPDSIEEELSTPWNREKKAFFDSSLSVSMFFSGFVVKAVVLFGVPMIAAYIGVKTGNVLNGCIGIIAGVTVSGIYMASSFGK